ncbi:MAG: hypothetical protein NTW86_06000, partial [Candidatus Sumerlaeota bacterium]|nr:hypothetical protein [Candidatus Sumerlaeota bacterium]
AITAAAQPAAQNQELDIQSFPDLNALIVRYVNPSDLKQIQDLVDLLDKPVPQVQITTKMVEVNESRAKEFSSDWTINNLTQASIDLGSSILNTRFAQDIDEFIGEFEPGVENTGSANLMKNVTVINLVTGGATPLNWTLRMLEAEGIINVVNGPLITVKSGQQGQFLITRSFTGYAATNTRGAGRANQNQNLQNQNVNALLPGGINTTGVNTGLNTGLNTYGTNVVSGRQVDMQLTPTVTSENNIEVSVDTLVLQDPTVNLGTLTSVTNTSNFGADQQAISNTLGLDTRTKDIQTVATVKNGGTIVLGGWTGERSQELTSGVPVLRNIPFVGKLFFSRNRASVDRTTIMIFLTVRIIPIE